MENEWIAKKLGDLLSHQKGFAFKSKDYRESGHGIARVSDFTDRSIDVSSCNFLAYELVSNHDSVMLKTGDVVVATVGSWPKNPASVVGKTIRVPEEANSFLLNQNAVKLAAKAGINQKFLFHLLKTDTFQNYIVSSAQGSANQASITLKNIFDFTVIVPPLPEQKAIAHILGSLDDKIELNRQMNATLEGMAQALFKSWFVDFDPVIDNALAAGTPIPEAFAVRAETRSKALANRDVAKQFPAAFQFTEEMGWIPEGWEVESIYDLISIIYGAPFKSSLFNSDGKGVSVIRIRDLKTGVPQNWTTEDHPKKTLIKTGDVIVGMDAEFRATIWPGESGYLNQRLFLARPKEYYVNNFFIQYTLKPQLEFEENTQVGTTVSHLGKKEIDKFLLLNPMKELLLEYSKKTTPLLYRLVSNNNDFKTLTNLRDTLLPKLISGELRIPEAEKLTEEALA